MQIDLHDKDIRFHHHPRPLALSRSLQLRFCLLEPFYRNVDNHWRHPILTFLWEFWSNYVCYSSTYMPKVYLLIFLGRLWSKVSSQSSLHLWSRYSCKRDDHPKNCIPRGWYLSTFSCTFMKKMTQQYLLHKFASGKYRQSSSMPHAMSPYLMNHLLPDAGIQKHCLNQHSC